MRATIALFALAALFGAHALPLIERACQGSACISSTDLAARQDGTQSKGDDTHPDSQYFSNGSQPRPFKRAPTPEPKGTNTLVKLPSAKVNVHDPSHAVGRRDDGSDATQDADQEGNQDESDVNQGQDQAEGDEGESQDQQEGDVAQEQDQADQADQTDDMDDNDDAQNMDRRELDKSEGPKPF